MENELEEIIAMVKEQNDLINQTKECLIKLGVDIEPYRIDQQRIEHLVGQIRILAL